MDLLRLCRVILAFALVLFLCFSASVTAGDIVHDDDDAPKKPGCENDFVLVNSILICYSTQLLLLWFLKWVSFISLWFLLVLFLFPFPFHLDFACLVFERNGRQGSNIPFDFTFLFWYLKEMEDLTGFSSGLVELDSLLIKMSIWVLQLLVFLRTKRVLSIS